MTQTFLRLRCSRLEGGYSTYRHREQNYTCMLRGTIFPFMSGTSLGSLRMVLARVPSTTNPGIEAHVAAVLAPLVESLPLHAALEAARGTP